MANFFSFVNAKSSTQIIQSKFANTLLGVVSSNLIARYKLFLSPRFLFKSFDLKVPLEHNVMK